MITVNDFKKFTSLQNNFYDDAIAQIVAGVISFVEGYCNNILLEKDVIEYIDGDGVDEDGDLLLSNRINLTNLKLYRNTGTEYEPVWTEMTTNEFVPYLDEGRISIDVAWCLISSRKVWKVTYTAGYQIAKAPNDLKLACLKLVSAMYNKRKSEGETSEGLDGANINFASSINDEMKSILAKYKSLSL